MPSRTHAYEPDSFEHVTNWDDGYHHDSHSGGPNAPPPYEPVMDDYSTPPPHHQYASRARHTAPRPARSVREDREQAHHPPPYSRGRARSVYGPEDYFGAEADARPRRAPMGRRPPSPARDGAMPKYGRDSAGAPPATSSRRGGGYDYPPLRRTTSKSAPPTPGRQYAREPARRDGGRGRDRDRSRGKDSQSRRSSRGTSSRQHDDDNRHHHHHHHHHDHHRSNGSSHHHRHHHDERPEPRRSKMSTSSLPLLAEAAGTLLSRSMSAKEVRNSDGGGRGSKGRSTSTSASKQSKASSGLSARIQRAAAAALQAGGMAAYNLRQTPGAWNGEKGARVATAALGAGVVDAFLKDPAKGDRTRDGGSGGGWKTGSRAPQPGASKAYYGGSGSGRQDIQTLGGALGGLILEQLVNRRQR